MDELEKRREDRWQEDANRLARVWVGHRVLDDGDAWELFSMVAAAIATPSDNQGMALVNWVAQQSKRRFLERRMHSAWRPGAPPSDENSAWEVVPHDQLPHYLLARLDGKTVAHLRIPPLIDVCNPPFMEDADDFDIQS